MSICTILLGQVATCGVEHPQPVVHSIVWFVLLAIAIAILALSYILTAVLAKTQKPKPAGLDQWDYPQVNEGTPKAVIFGDCWTEAEFVCWFGNYRTKKIKAKGGK